MNTDTRIVISMLSSIYTDLVIIDEAYSAKDVVFYIPTQGVKINGLFMLAAGKGLHPTKILLYGVPGKEKNLDLALNSAQKGLE